MKIKLLTFFLAISALFFLNGCCRPEIIGNVPNTLRPQETNNWCWAATTQMLAQHVGIAVNQCDLANHRFSKTNCCNPQTAGRACPKTNDCNTPGWLELDFAGVAFSESATALTWDALRRQIFCAKKPMGFAYGTSGVVGHVVVIKGYVTVGSTSYVVLNDPWDPCVGQERLITYNEYQDPAGTATHWNTWYDIRKK
ncbi:MAG: C39 family peptidase [Saprospiraceae bacterium]|nr:C39 family peptidase [Saprospiraceae bacterium]